MFVSSEDFEEWHEEDLLIEVERELTREIDRDLWLEFCVVGTARAAGTGIFE